MSFENSDLLAIRNELLNTNIYLSDIRSTLFYFAWVLTVGAVFTFGYLILESMK